MELERAVTRIKSHDGASHIVHNAQAFEFQSNLPVSEKRAFRNAAGQLHSRLRKSRFVDNFLSNSFQVLDSIPRHCSFSELIAKGVKINEHIVNHISSLWWQGVAFAVFEALEFPMVDAKYQASLMESAVLCPFQQI